MHYRKWTPSQPPSNSLKWGDMPSVSPCAACSNPTHLTFASHPLDSKCLPRDLATRVALLECLLPNLGATVLARQFSRGVTCPSNVNLATPHQRRTPCIKYFLETADPNYSKLHYNTF
jgi:hypothetical protein